MDKDFEKQEKRIESIFPNSMEDVSRRLETIKYFKDYLNNNITNPLIMTGVEDFPWEEFYILGPGNKEEYEELKKTQPSYTDTYELIDLDEDCNEDYGILANVVRLSDKKTFQLPLADLTAIDSDSDNYQLIDDYSVWYFNY